MHEQLDYAIEKQLDLLDVDELQVVLTRCQELLGRHALAGYEVHPEAAGHRYTVDDARRYVKSIADADGLSEVDLTEAQYQYIFKEASNFARRGPNGRAREARFKNAVTRLLEIANQSAYREAALARHGQ